MRGSSNWTLGKKLFTESIVKHQNKLLREVVMAPSLSVQASVWKMVLDIQFKVALCGVRRWTR